MKPVLTEYNFDLFRNWQTAATRGSFMSSNLPKNACRGQNWEISDNPSQWVS